MDQKCKKIPKSALTLYVKLYCRRKRVTDSKYSNLLEATKSWVSLGECEKQQFVNKLKEYKTNYKNRFAEFLKNVEPYLKRKNSRRWGFVPISGIIIQAINYLCVEFHANLFSSFSVPQQDVFIIKNFCRHNFTNSNRGDNQQELIETDLQSKNNTTMNTFEETATKMEYPESTILVTDPTQYQELTVETETEILPEPTPPNVKSGKELFEIVTLPNAENNKSWQSLSKNEKSRYQCAVLAIKKAYLSEYKAFLETLSPKGLFDHYNKIK